MGEQSVLGRAYHIAYHSCWWIIKNAELKHGHENAAHHIVKLRPGDNVRCNRCLKRAAKSRVIRHLQIQPIVDRELHAEIGSPVAINETLESEHSFELGA